MTRTIALLVLVAFAAGGCLFVAYPTRGDTPKVRVVTEEATKFIRRGVTTREEVVLRLGSPDLATDEDQRFVYASSYRTGSIVGVMIAIVGLAGRMAEQPRHRRTIVEIRFDDRAVVRDLKVESETVFMRQEIIRTVP